MEQEACAKKKSKPQPKEKSEEVVPQTAKEKVTEAIGNVLKEVGVARTAAITLQGLEYADNLSQAIKSHADGVEAYYSEVQRTLKGSPSEKELAKVLQKIEEKSQATKKLQAGWLSFWHMSSNVLWPPFAPANERASHRRTQVIMFSCPDCMTPYGFNPIRKMILLYNRISRSIHDISHDLSVFEIPQLSGHFPAPVFRWPYCLKTFFQFFTASVSKATIAMLFHKGSHPVPILWWLFMPGCSQRIPGQQHGQKQEGQRKVKSKGKEGENFLRSAESSGTMSVVRRCVLRVAVHMCHHR